MASWTANELLQTRRFEPAFRHTWPYLSARLLTLMPFWISNEGHLGAKPLVVHDLLAHPAAIDMDRLPS
jgi:hypothetical protein